MRPEPARARFAAQSGFGPEAVDDIAHWGERLREWNGRINLVAASTLDSFWERHALDSAQLVPHLGPAARVVDFGSGGGFPALALAIHAKHAGLARDVHMIESVGKKASFLKTIVRELRLPATVHAARIEAVPSLQADVVTARAFAPLPRLLPLATRHLCPEGRLVLLKGERVQSEVESAEPEWSFDVHSHPSITDETGRIVVISGLKRRECFT